MKKLLLIVVVIFISGLAGAKNSYLFNKVLVNGAYEQAIYPSTDVVCLLPGEKYSASYYLNASFISGNTVIEVLSAPDYLELPLIFNDTTASGFNFYFANNESGQEAYFQTDITENGFKSSWSCWRYPSGWLGDIEFINQLKVGDSIQYRISTVCSGLNGQSYHNYHLRTIKCVAADSVLKLGDLTNVFDPFKSPVSAFPNPFIDELNINSFQNVDAFIVDASGRVLASQRLQPGLAKISTAGLKPGIYFLKAGKTVVKLIKQ
ncbi:MAG: T9SS type A sorting domain-containing protein [Candidatus Falkowbacteria bacterium]|nr:MAG: T9SS type A sorting domain-containing protein [Candidatus Falkowbacteria bacterium]